MPRRIILLGVILLASIPATAHHGRGIFDLQRTITIDGVVTEFSWKNPHVYLFVETQNTAGETSVWSIEIGSATSMRKRGWSSDTFEPGDSVVVEAHPARNPERTMALVYSVEKAGITRLGRGDTDDALSVVDESAPRATGHTGTWIVLRSHFGEFFAVPHEWALTYRGRDSLSSYDEVTMNPQVQCMSRTAPWFMISGVQKIDVEEDFVSIHSEYESIKRTVRMDVANHDGAEVSPQGHSIGWWEGDVLVVDTTHFADHRTGNARGVPSGAQKHLVERFELDPERSSMSYRFVLEDPEYLAAPISGAVQSAFRPDVEFTPIACDPDSASRFIEQ